MLFVESCVIINYVVRAFVALLSPQKPRKTALQYQRQNYRQQDNVESEAEAVTKQLRS